jgi:hypothetical protein
MVILEIPEPKVQTSILYAIGSRVKADCRVVQSGLAVSEMFLVILSGVRPPQAG